MYIDIAENGTNGYKRLDKLRYDVDRTFKYYCIYYIHTYVQLESLMRCLH